MKVLVTGGAGFIGSHLVDRLVARGDDVCVLDNLDPQVHSGEGHPANIEAHVRSEAVRFLRGDVTDRDSIARATGEAEVIVHLAAAVGVGQSMYRPHYYVHNNCGGTGLLLDRLVGMRAKIRRLVVASSMSVYGEGSCRCDACGGTDPRPRGTDRLSQAHWELECARCGAPADPQPTSETKTPEIRSIYAATKKHQEELFLSFGAAYGVPTFALRFFNAYGPRQALGNPYTGVAAIFVSRLLNGRPPLVYEDGRQRRDLIDVRDVARAITLAMDAPDPGVHVVNVGTGRPLTIAEVAQALADRLGSAVSPAPLGQYRAGDIRHCYADTRRARRLLGFEAQHRFEDGIDDLVAWCRTAQRPRDRLVESIEELRARGLVG